MRLFPYERWREQLPELRERYRSNKPCPHIALPGFFDEPVARGVLAEFPGSEQGTWTQWKHYNENKQGKTNPKEFPPHISAVMVELLSPEFVAFVSELTGIQGLRSDPDFDGGGLHLSERGGFLNIHTDYTSHYYRPTWRRRVNMLIYFNEGWQDAWGGHLEFWDKAVTRSEARYAPLFNHAVLFTTTEDSPHGHPEPMLCPDGVTRKSIALYYFTEEEGRALARPTNYQGRPTDGLMKRLLIWADKKAVGVYSFMKRRLGLSDKLVSRILARKKK